MLRGPPPSSLALASRVDDAGSGRRIPWPWDRPRKRRTGWHSKKQTIYKLETGERTQKRVTAIGGTIMDDREHAGKPVKIDDILSEIEEEIYKNEQAIKLRAAIEYMVSLVDEENREDFNKAEERATTIEDLKKILHAIKRHIGQETAINVFKL